MKILPVFVLSICLAASAAPQIDGEVTFEQAHDSLVTVTYGIKNEPAIVTVDVQTNGPGGYASIDQTWLTNVTGDVNVKVPVGKNKKIYWRPADTVPGRFRKDGARAVVTLHPTNLPPQYLVIEVSSATAAGSASFRFYPNAGQIPFGITDNVYKSRYYPMRRIDAAGVVWPMGAGGSYQHPVALPESYYIGVFEVTQKHMKNAIASLPTTVLSPSGDYLPAAGAITYTNIRGGNNWPSAADHSFVNSWAYLQHFRNRVGTAFKLDLPTEAQWEFAALAGEYAAEYPHGSDAVDGLGAYAWHSGNVPEGTTIQEVGTRLPNEWGLYDMFGNVCEWCLDNYRTDYGLSLADYDEVNFAGPATDNVTSEATSNTDVADKVVRGGSYADGETDLKSRYRTYIYRGASNPVVGFRLCAPVVYPY